MKFRHVILGLIAAIMSVTSFAGTLNVSKDISLIAFDGQKVRKSSVLSVAAGQTHQAVFRVEALVKDGSSPAIFESFPIVVSFKGSSEDMTISVPKLRTTRDGKKFEENLKVIVKTASGTDVASHYEKFPQMGGFMPDTNVIDDLADYNNSNGVARVSAFAVSASGMPNAMNASSKARKVVVQGENVAEQMLQYWFQQADKETQTRFLNWANK